jgi:hypothetical protein
MIRNFKALGLALVAVLALGGAVVSSASAQQGLLTSTGPVTLTGAETGGGGGAPGGPLTLTAKQTGAEGSNALTAFAGKVVCANATYTGHKVTTTPHGLISSDVTQVTVTPHYGKCTLFGKPATVDMNGCDYVFDFEGTSGPGKFNVKTTITCPSEKDIEMTMFETETKHTEGSSFCRFVITESAAGYTGLSATDTGNGRIDINGSAKGLTVDEKSGEPVLCAEATTTSGEMHLDIEVEGKSAGGAAVPIVISDEGKLTWEEEEPPTAGPNASTMFGNFMQCLGSTYTGHKVANTPHAFVSSGASAVTLTPHYKQFNENCKGSLGTTMTIDMNGCDYVLNLGETTGGVSGTYGVTFDIVCPVGKSITWTMWFSATAHTSEPNTPKCIQHFSSQTGLKGLHATDTGNGTIDLTGTLTGITFTQTRNSILCPAGTHSTTAEFHTDVSMSGKNEAGAATSISLSHN